VGNDPTGVSEHAEESQSLRCVVRLELALISMGCETAQIVRIVPKTSALGAVYTFIDMNREVSPTFLVLNQVICTDFFKFSADLADEESIDCAEGARVVVFTIL